MQGPIIITSLPESLASGISLTGGKSIYLEVDILQPIMEEPDQKALSPGRYPHPNSQPYQDHSPKTRRRGQHDHGGKRSPVLSNVGHVWSCVRELNPKKTKFHVHTHTSIPQTERYLWAGGHIIPGECPR